jgi:hypothetical protein
MSVAIKFLNFSRKLIELIEILEFVAFSQKPPDSEKVNSEICQRRLFSLVKRKMTVIIGPI